MELFRQLSRLRRYERILVEIVVFEIGGSLLAQVSGGRGSPTSGGVRKLKSLGADCRYVLLECKVRCKKDTEHMHSVGSVRCV